MAVKKVKLREWTKDDVGTLKTLAREGAKTTVIARKLKRSVGATHQKAMRLGVTLGGGRAKKAPRAAAAGIRAAKKKEKRP